MEEFCYPHSYKIENEHWWFAAQQRIRRVTCERICVRRCSAAAIGGRIDLRRALGPARCGCG